MERPIDSYPNVLSTSPAGLFRFIFIAAVLLLPLYSWLSAIGSPFTYFRYDLPPGQVMYILAKLAGMYAFVLLWLQVMIALLTHDRLQGYLVPRWTPGRHRLLGITTLLMAWGHFLCFFSAVSIRKDTIAYDLLLPEFENGIYFFAVSLGWFALVGLTLVALFGLMRAKSQGIWVLAHRLSLAVFFVALVHAQTIGSEAKSGLWFFMHLSFAAAVLIALARWLIRRQA